MTKTKKCGLPTGVLRRTVERIDLIRSIVFATCPEARNGCASVRGVLAGHEYSHLLDMSVEELRRERKRAEWYAETMVIAQAYITKPRAGLATIGACV